MFDSLKPYSAYKDSGVLWLGEVPVHWEVKRSRLVLREVNERSLDGSEELLTVSQYTGVTRRRERGVSEDGKLLTNAASLIGYKRVGPGDLVMNIMLAWNGSLGVSSIEGIASPAYCVFRAKSDIEPHFFHYLFRTPLFAGAFKTVSTGVVDSRLRLYPDVFSRLPSLLPPKAEQSAIVRFLDHTDRRIRRYIRAKKKLIKLLEEQKQVIIHRAVTRGVDPNVRLKPSGVEWLGPVPEHWLPTHLKRVATIQTGITLGKNYESMALVERPYLRVANVQVAKLNLAKITTVRVPLSEAEATSLQEGDVLMTEGGDIDKLGRGCIWRAEIEGCLHQNHVFAVRPKVAALLPEFLVALMASHHGRSYFESTAKKTTNLASTNSTTLGTFPLFLPKIDEQQQILAYLEGDTSALNLAQARGHRETELLREYRTRLIADVATGKLDVRAAAAALPDEVEEPAIAEGMQALDEPEPAQAEESTDTKLEHTEADFD